MISKLHGGNFAHYYIYVFELQVAQVCAYELGIPMDKVKVKATNSLTSANSITTGGSITSENCCEVRNFG